MPRVTVGLVPVLAGPRGCHCSGSPSWIQTRVQEHHTKHVHIPFDEALDAVGRRGYGSVALADEYGPPSKKKESTNRREEDSIDRIIGLLWVGPLLDSMKCARK